MPKNTLLHDGRMKATGTVVDDERDLIGGSHLGASMDVSHCLSSFCTWVNTVNTIVQLLPFVTIFFSMFRTGLGTVLTHALKFPPDASAPGKYRRFSIQRHVMAGHEFADTRYTICIPFAV